MPSYIDHKLPDKWDQIIYRYDPMEQLMISLEKLVTGYPPKLQYDHHECRGLYSGPTSVAYLFLQLSRSHPYLQIKGLLHKQWATWYLEGVRMSKIVTVENNGIRSEYLAYRAVRAAAAEGSFPTLPTFWEAIKDVALSKESKHFYMSPLPVSLSLQRLHRAIRNLSLIALVFKKSQEQFH